MFRISIEHGGDLVVNVALHLGSIEVVDLQAFEQLSMAVCTGCVEQRSHHNENVDGDEEPRGQHREKLRTQDEAGAPRHEQPESALDRVSLLPFPLFAFSPFWVIENMV